MNQEDKIRKLAYRLYLARGKEEGNAVGDWLKAERALLRRSSSFKFIWHPLFFLTKHISKKFFNILLSILIVFCIIWLFYKAGPLFGYKIDLKNSIERKILDNFCVYARPPKIRLFTIYGTELGFNSTEQVEFIKEGQLLRINPREEDLFVGVWNDEGRNLEAVTFILFIPNGVEVIDCKEWIPLFTNKQYQYDYPKKIRPNSGLMLDPTLKVKFLNINGQDQYDFDYIVLSDDFLPKKGKFFIRVQ